MTTRFVVAEMILLLLLLLLCRDDDRSRSTEDLIDLRAKVRISNNAWNSGSCIEFSVNFDRAGKYIKSFICFQMKLVEKRRKMFQQKQSVSLDCGET